MDMQAPHGHARSPVRRVVCLPSGDGVDCSPMAGHKIYSMRVGAVYSAYVAKAERKQRTKAEVDEIIRWLTGYAQSELDTLVEGETDFEIFFAQAPAMNPQRDKIKGVVCGVRVEEVEEELMREIRYLDKLIEELATGKPMARILRS